MTEYKNDPALKHMNKLAKEKSMPQEAKDIAAIANRFSENAPQNMNLNKTFQFMLCAMEGIDRAHKEAEKQRKGSRFRYEPFNLKNGCLPRPIRV